ncbi:MAG: efflux RND transporter periplasmic adaptor subunit [Acidobacteria bacterium]|nr:MAG: efflux RND transporter periplasmic adaptor subunit [Acidobacteriota bacterium]PYQ84639.1 MAG: efflux RND transporter periplasmic adaptor subunit [Acidobacteriota bacterium]PYQ89009.1 MAG: efflux RND transporter periplasmic adaptor subunit [Acidobacteriota bacterium]
METTFVFRHRPLCLSAFRCSAIFGHLPAFGFHLCVIASLVAAGCNGSTSAAGPGGGSRAGRGRGGDGGPAPVVTAKVVEKDVPLDLAAIGNVEAYTTISVRSQITGQLQEALFREGDVVKKGEQLFTIDRRPFEAALLMAEANLTRDKALLAQAEAQLARDASNAEYQQLTSERQAQLQQRGIISKDQAEQSRSQADATRAVVNADKANIESAKAQLAAQEAAVDNARVQLGYTVIRSPIDGRTGNLAVKVGNLVTANNTELMTIAQLQPVYVTFTVPAMHLPTIKRHMTGDPLHVTAVPQDADATPATGRLTFVDNAVEMTTDTIRLKATFDNADRRLWPGQFARVTLRLATLPHATVVPSQAVQTGQDGQYVFVVKQDSTVEQRPVTTAQRADQDIVVEKGLKSGETVVTEGQLRLEPGSRVTTDLNAAPGGRGGRGGRGRGRG